jgi:hypothetical protein
MEVRIVMMIQDALSGEAPEKEAEDVRHLMKRMMTNASRLEVRWNWRSSNFLSGFCCSTSLHRTERVSVSKFAKGEAT